MARFGFPDLKIELDVAVGGLLGDISAFVTEINGYSVEAVLEEVTAANDKDDAWAKVGITRKGEIVLTGPYDDTASKLVAITKATSALGEQRTLKLTFDGATVLDVKNVETLIQKVERNPKRDALHAYSVTLRPTGAIT
jgi:hypothetical protein